MRTYCDAVLAATVGAKTMGVGADTGATVGEPAMPAHPGNGNVYVALVLENGNDAPICCVRFGPAKSPTRNPTMRFWQQSPRFKTKTLDTCCGVPRSICSEGELSPTAEWHMDTGAPEHPGADELLVASLSMQRLAGKHNALYIDDKMASTGWMYTPSHPKTITSPRLMRLPARGLGRKIVT